MGYADIDANTRKEPFVQMSKVNTPAEVLLIGDISTPPVPPASINASQLLWRSSIDYIPALHNGGANYGFVDGHVKWMNQDYVFAHKELFQRH
jgi:prepilin-type processing-associated H-X9-DG protein